MPSFPAFKTKPYYDALKTWLTTSLNEDGTLKSAAVAAELAKAETVVQAAADAVNATPVASAVYPGTAGASGDIVAIGPSGPAWVNREFSVTAFGATGDGTTDDTAAIQATFTAANGRPVFFPTPSVAYRITAAIIINRSGQRIIGQSGMRTIVRQDTPGANAFELRADATWHIPSVIMGVTFEQISITGPGVATSTGAGIDGAPTTGYNGDFLTCHNVTIEGFDKGIYLDHWDQSWLERVWVRSCRIGMHFRGNVNTIHAAACAISGGHVCETAYLFDGGGNGVVLYPGDVVEAECAVELSGVAASMIGGNFESITGTEVVNLVSGSSLVCSGTRRLKGASGAEVPFFRAAADCILHIDTAISTGYLADTPLWVKDGSTAVVTVSNPARSLTTPVKGSEQGLATFNVGPFPTRLDNAIPAAGTGMRGQIVAGFSRDTANVDDRLVYGIQTRNDTYELIELTDPRHYYSTNGGTSAHGRIDSPRHYVGRKDFTTAAATSTDVVVNVGPFSERFAFTATVDAWDKQAYAIGRTYNGTTGDVTFRVWHPNDTGGGIAMKLHYRIDVRV